MAEGLGPGEVAKEIAEHNKHARSEATGRDRLVTIIEAALLAAVALLAAWSGFSSAKWSTESRLQLAQANAARTQSNRAAGDAAADKNFDSSTFSAWFTAYTLGNQEAMTIAERRFRPEFKVAFDAWLATNPETNPNAAPGPTYMPEYVQPDADKANELDTHADELYAEGAHSASTADDYVRTTVLLASVLFLVGISGHFRVRAARYGLVALGSVIMVTALVIILLAPKPPA